MHIIITYKINMTYPFCHKYLKPHSDYGKLMYQLILSESERV